MRIEYHVVDHCNLNCKGCAHFSNISPHSFRDVNDFEKEISCLASKIKLDELRIMGGEPLLHPNLVSFLSVARKYYTKSKITVCTNAIALNRMNDDFWDCMRKNKIGLELTMYPPMKEKFGDVIRLVHKNRIKIMHIHVADYFVGTMNRKGDSDPVITHKHCTMRICHHLRGGVLYLCPVACYMDYYNSYFQQEIPRDNGIDIFENSGSDLEKYVTTSKDVCRYCTTKCHTFEWAQSKKEVNEWNGEL